MKKIQIADMQASQIILGCMRIIEPGKNPVKVIETAYENGINLITRIFMVLDSVKRFLPRLWRKPLFDGKTFISNRNALSVQGLPLIFQKNILSSR